MTSSHRVLASQHPRPIALVAVLMIAAACNPDSTGIDGRDPEPPVAAVVVDPDSTWIATGQAVPLKVTVLAADGGALKGRSVRWSSSDDAVAQVDGTGRVLGRSEGVATITAASGRKSGSAWVRVAVRMPASVDRVDVTPAEIILDPWTTRDLRAVPRTAEGAELSGRGVVWASSDERLATVSPSGRVEARQGGMVWITALSEGKAGRAQVTVRDWAEYPLRTVAGRVLPVVVHTSKVRDERGVELNRSVRATSGSLRINPGARRYEQRLTLETWEDVYWTVDGRPVFCCVQRKEVRLLHDAGVAEPLHAEARTLHFRSDSLGGRTFTGFRLTAGGVEVTQRVIDTGGPVPLLFSK